MRPESRWLVAPLDDVLAGRARWQSVATFEDEVTGLDLHRGQLYLIANHGTPRGRLLRTPAAAPSLASAEELVPQNAQVLEDIARARDGLYLRYMDGGLSRLLRLGDRGAPAPIALPIDGTIGDVFATPEEDGVLVSLSGWLDPTGIWAVDAAGKLSDTGLTPRPHVDLTPYETHRLFAIAKDGTHVPYSIIHRKA